MPKISAEGPKIPTEGELGPWYGPPHGGDAAAPTARAARRQPLRREHRQQDRGAGDSDADPASPVDDPVLAAVLASLPPELADRRVLTARQAAAFVGLSLVHWRRVAPPPVMLSTRRQGWVLADIINWIDERRGQRAA
jgi:predicted DNA-binding transcriptional regulator AlpA